jgi:hypothetical protein
MSAKDDTNMTVHTGLFGGASQHRPLGAGNYSMNKAKRPLKSLRELNEGRPCHRWRRGVVDANSLGRF